jgi:hypothetical protein
MKKPEETREEQSNVGRHNRILDRV